MFVAITTLVLGAGAFLMERAGVSLRPVFFMIVFLGIVAGPQIAFHLAQAFGVIPERDLTWTLAGPVSPEASNFWLYRPPVLIALIAILVAIATVWAFRGSAWAATIPARPGVAAPARDLRERVLTVNSIDAPFTVTERDDGRIAVTWRFADAKWVDHARAHGMRRTHRILLELDEPSRTVYPTEQQSRLDWSAGAQGGSLRWATEMGIVFFQHEHQRVFGLQVDERGRLVPKLSYSYTFNLQEMKAPLISAVTESGWRWRPTLWHGPQWLRWLTH